MVEQWPSRSFRILAEMEAFINWCIGNSSSTKKLAFTESSLVICDADLAARNILSLPDSRFCILDWGSASIYLRFFEVYSLVGRSPWEPHCGAVLTELGFPDESNDSEIQLLDQVYGQLTTCYIIRRFITSKGVFNSHLLATIYF